MAFLVASASSSSIWIPHWHVSYFSVCISEGSSAMIDKVVYERSVLECVNIGCLQQQKYKKISDPTSHSPRFFSHLHSKSWVRHCCALYSKWKVGTSASVCRVTLCVHVYCLVHFVIIAKMYGNLFSGRPSKVLPWSWLKSIDLGLET